MTDWGRKMFVSPGVIRDGQLLTNDLVEINLGIRILLGSSYFKNWKTRRCSSPAIRWATRWTAGTRGTSTRFPPGQAGLRRQVQLGHVPALV